MKTRRSKASDRDTKRPLSQEGAVTSTRFNEFKAEPAVAAYLGFTHFQAFRNFLVSWPVLKWLEYYHAVCGARPPYGALEILRDVGDLATYFPDSLDGIAQKFPVAAAESHHHRGVRQQNQNAQDKRIAAAFSLLKQDIETMSSRPSVDNDALQASFQRQTIDGPLFRS